ncbi:MAG: alkaline phosphatase family protein [Candidatus Eremiobacter antarcticus]|nr:hypothetical protein [Candidatus Eremiobacteraeota bacterium]
MSRYMFEPRASIVLLVLLGIIGIIFACKQAGILPTGAGIPSQSPRIATTSSIVAESGTVAAVNIYGPDDPMLVLKPGSPYDNISVYAPNAPTFKVGNKVNVAGNYATNGSNHWIDASSISLQGGPTPTPVPTGGVITETGTVDRVDPYGTAPPDVMVHITAGSPCAAINAVGPHPGIALLDQVKAVGTSHGCNAWMADTSISKISGSPSPSPFPSPSAQPSPSIPPSPTPTATAGTINVVVMENQGYSDINGSANAPYINSLKAKGAFFTAAYAITHPSLPNYLALFSGSTQGVTDDACTYTFSTSNLASQLAFAGYAEGDPGDQTCTSGDFAKKHVPWKYWGYNTLPASGAVKFWVPDLCHDMHDCSVKTGDDYLKGLLPTISGTVILLWDEGYHADYSSNHIFMVMYGPGIAAGQTVSTTVTLYSVLKWIEAQKGVSCLANACSAASIVLK